MDTGSQYLANFTSTGSTGGTAVLMTATNAGQLTNTILSVVASGYTTGYTGNVVSITGCSTTGAANVLLVTGANTSAGNAVGITTTALTTGNALKITAAAANLTTGFYLACNDGALNTFTVGANGHLTSNQTTAPTPGFSGGTFSADLPNILDRP